MKIRHEKRITIDDVNSVATEHEKVFFADEVRTAVEQSRLCVEKILQEDKPVYGVNTGFGIFANKKFSLGQIAKLNHNLIISHAVGTGQMLAEEIVRAAIFIRAVTLSKGFSGVRFEIIETLADLINKNVVPLIPEKGSLGSSGDLCQLSHMALVLTTDEKDLSEESGLAKYRNQVLSGKEAMEKAGIQRHVLTAKEGLALNNGATFTAAIASLAVYQAEYLIKVADLCAALTMEALCARSSPFDARVHQVRNHKGQIETAKSITQMINGSSLIDSQQQVQDGYSIRCIPQVHGAVKDSVEHVKQIVENEINAATDNPLIFEPGEAISGGNFHGEPLGLVMDFLGIALCELGAISERRINRLLDANTNNGLPQMLVDEEKNAGLNSGLMMPHYTAASLVLENQTLATPDAIRSLPTSAGQEDHNANAMTAARHAYEIVENLRQIISIELFTALRALELRLKRTPGILGKETGKIYTLLKQVVQYTPDDTLWYKEIEKINQLIEKRDFLIYR